MIDSTKFQYYTHAARLRGFADGLNEDRNLPLIHMLNKAALLLEHAWNEYNETLPPEQQIGDYK